MRNEKCLSLYQGEAFFCSQSEIGFQQLLQGGLWLEANALADRLPLLEDDDAGDAGYTIFGGQGGAERLSGTA